MTLFRISAISCLLAALFFSTSVQAQMRGWEVGPMIGTSTYFGDLNTRYHLKELGLSGSMLVRYNFNDRLGFAFAGNYARIAGSDVHSGNIYEQRRNLSFYSNIFEGVARTEFNFLPYTHGHREYFFTPYIFAGLSVFSYNPKTELNGTVYELRKYGTEGQFEGEEYNTSAAGLAYGLGFKVDLSYRWSINVELDVRKALTDYLDDVSTAYPDMRDLLAQRNEEAVLLSDRSGEPRIGLEGRQRGNGKKNDHFLIGKIGVLYYFGSIRCPDMGK